MFWLRALAGVRQYSGAPFVRGCALMGLFDFLKTTVRDKNKKEAAKAAAAGKAGPRKAGGGSFIAFDGKAFPLAAITTKGFVTANFDASLIAGQNARIAVTVDDSYGRFSFATNVTISEADGKRCVGAWMVLAPDLEAAIRQYGQNRKAAGK